MNAQKAPEDLEVNDKEHCDYADNLINCNGLYFYEDVSGWFKGKIIWYNTKKEKLGINYGKDDSYNYVTGARITWC